MGRDKNKHEVDRLTFQVPKKIKESLRKKFKPLIKKEVDKWKVKN
jgi:hypothetical protein